MGKGFGGIMGFDVGVIFVGLAIGEERLITGLEMGLGLKIEVVGDFGTRGSGLPAVGDLGIEVVGDLGTGGSDLATTGDLGTGVGLEIGGLGMGLEVGLEIGLEMILGTALGAALGTALDAALGTALDAALGTGVVDNSEVPVGTLGFCVDNIAVVNAGIATAATPAPASTT